MLILIFIFGDELKLFLTRQKIARDGLPSHARLFRVSCNRLLGRALAAIILLVMWFFRTAPIIERVYVGAYIGFVTNALVTVLILHVFIPMLKESIARTAKDRISDLIQLEEEGNTVPNAVSAIISVIGLLVPGGLVTTAIGGFLGLFLRRKTKDKIENIKQQKFEEAKQQIEDGIKAMSRGDIRDMMDEMVGAMLLLIEAAGLVTGAFFGLLSF